MATGETYRAATLFFWDGTQQVKIVYNAVANYFHPGFIWNLGWWGVKGREKTTGAVYALRSAGGQGAVEVYALIEDDTAVRGTHYQFANVADPGFPLPNTGRYIKFTWAEGQIGAQAIPVQLLDVDADVRFKVTFVAARRVGSSFLETKGKPKFIWEHPSLSSVPDEYWFDLLQQPDEKGVVGFQELEVVHNEDQTVTVRVHRTAGKVGAVSVAYHTEDGTGVEGSDYDEVTGTLNWADDEDGPKDINIDLGDVTGDKTFRVVLDTPGGGVYLDPTHRELLVTIADVTGPGRFAFERTLLQGEDGDTLALVVRRIGGHDGEVTVTLDLDDGSALGGTHYTDESEVLTFLDDDDTPQTVNVDLIGDGDIPLLFTARLHTPTGGATVEPSGEIATIIILPTDAPPLPVFGDLLDGQWNPFTREDELHDGMSLARQSILTRVLDGKVGDEVGWAGGGDYMTPGAFSNPTWKQKHRLSVKQVML